MPAVIVLGEMTDHGGEVIESSGVTDTHGKGIARVGDKVYCPKKGHGTTVIVTGENTMVIDGKAVAFHGCKTSCGATLISSQMVTSVEFGSGASAASASASVASSIGIAGSRRPDSRSPDGIKANAHSYTSQEEQSKLPFDEQFRAVDDKSGASVEGLAYFVRVSSGAVYSGFTDSQGLVPRIQTEQAETMQVWFGIAALHMQGANHD